MALPAGRHGTMPGADRVVEAIPGPVCSGPAMPATMGEAMLLPGVSVSGRLEAALPARLPRPRPCASQSSAPWA